MKNFLLVLGLLLSVEMVTAKLASRIRISNPFDAPMQVIITKQKHCLPQDPISWQETVRIEPYKEALIWGGGSFINCYSSVLNITIKINNIIIQSIDNPVFNEF